MEATSAASAEGFSEWEMVDNDLSVFRPRNREGSQINPEPETQEKESSVPPSPAGHLSGNKEIFRPFWNCWIRKSAARVWNLVCIGSGLWAFRSVTAIVGAVLMCLAAARAQRWRRNAVEDKSQLVLLIREKDQKIKQLLVEIGKMNELLMRRRKVPVLRIGMSSRLMV